MIGLETIIGVVAPALVPAILDGAKTVISKIIGVDPASPKSIDEVIRLRDSDTMRLKVLAELDKPYGEISKWVANLRASFRYIAVGSILLIYFVSLFINPARIDPATHSQLDMLAGQCMFFILGDRAYNHIKNGK